MGKKEIIVSSKQMIIHKKINKLFIHFNHWNHINWQTLITLKKEI